MKVLIQAALITGSGEPKTIGAAITPDGYVAMVISNKGKKSVVGCMSAREATTLAESLLSAAREEADNIVNAYVQAGTAR